MENPSHLRVPPQALEAEMSVLGGVLLDNAAIYRAIEIIDQADLYRESHRKIFGAMLELSNRREPCDLITLTEELKRTGSLDAAGGAAYLATLVDYVPTAANITYYCNIVKEKAVARNVLTIATKLATDAYSTDSSELLERAQRDLFTLATTNKQQSAVYVRDLNKEFIDTMQKRYEQKASLTGITTGLPDLDKITSGLQPSDLIIIAARPSMGKTVLGLNIAERAAKSGKTVVVFSLEMSKEQLMMRLAASMSGVDMQKMQTGRFLDTDWPQLQKASAIAHTLPLLVDDPPALNVTALRAKCLQLALQHDLDMIVIDYLQLMTSSKSKENRQQEISDISRSLKALAKELNVPIVALSQLNRSLEARNDKRPMMSDLRESGAIEQDADVIMFIYRESVYCEACKTDTCTDPDHDKSKAEVIIGKHRNGPLGTVNLIFNGANARFDSAAHPDRGAYA